MSDLERIGDLLRSSSVRPPIDPRLTAIRAAWPLTVGEQIARNSVPVRIARDALIVHCFSAAWASELTLLERDLAGRLEAALDDGRPLRLRFEVGDTSDARRAAERSPAPAPQPPSPEQRALARELAAAVSNPELRASVQRAIEASLQRPS